jgi:AAA domain
VNPPATKSAVARSGKKSLPESQHDAFDKAVDIALRNGTEEQFSDWAFDCPWEDYDDTSEKKIWRLAEVEAGRLALDEYLERKSAADGKPKAKKSSLIFYSPSEIQNVSQAHDFFESLYFENQISVVYGAPRSGKTFALLDQVAHAALGRTWQGLEVDQTNVLYIALEGSSGMRMRRDAWCKHNGVSNPEKLPVHFADGFLDLRESQTTRRAIVDYMKAHNIKWLVIDTLSRALAGGDENSAKDMGKLHLGADEIKRLTGSHVTIVHHSGKDTSKGARGSSLLLGNIETEISITRHGDSRTMELTKQKEGEDGLQWKFKLLTVELGQKSRRGKLIKSCVAEYGGAEFEIVDELSERDRAAFRILTQLAGETETRDDEGYPIVSKASFCKALKSSHWPNPGCKAPAFSNAVSRALTAFAQEYKVLNTNGNIKCSHAVNCSREPA